MPGIEVHKVGAILEFPGFVLLSDEEGGVGTGIPGLMQVSDSALFFQFTQQPPGVEVTRLYGQIFPIRERSDFEGISLFRNCRCTCHIPGLFLIPVLQDIHLLIPVRIQVYPALLLQYPAVMLFRVEGFAGKITWHRLNFKWLRCKENPCLQAEAQVFIKTVAEVPDTLGLEEVVKRAHFSLVVSALPDF